MTSTPQQICISCGDENGLEDHFVLACCRSILCAICLGYYAESAETEDKCVRESCEMTASEELVFRSESQVDDYWKRKRIAEEEAEIEALRRVALESVKVEIPKAKPKAPEIEKQRNGRRQIVYEDPESSTPIRNVNKRKMVDTVEFLAKRTLYSDRREEKPMRRERSHRNPFGGQVFEVF
ncbi:hypothetical protein QR680_008657 [Steinernema hermaphroditum]|uniref:Uncharacterized protein n=1 Tax=Steinernema hermaphroditum TaxID=289476 RepID=A0AA39IHD4_9BILA|nr:hypothetical protein QR680_008657 [Steinernema hermaphroditum]